MIKHPISNPRSQIYGFKVHLFFLKNRNYRNPDTRFNGAEVNFSKQCRVLMSLREKALENIVGKGENVDDNHVFPLFLNFFSTHSDIDYITPVSFYLSSAESLNLD